MDHTESLWRGRCRRIDLRFEERAAVLVLPEQADAERRWLLKTEYFSAFQDLEYEMVCRGFALAYLENRNRWGTPDDLAAKKRFRDLLTEEYGLNARCVPVGMSCGGLHAVKQAAYYPEMVSALYLDAPVIDLLSCPFHLAEPERPTHEETRREVLEALGLTFSELLAYRDHPLDRIPELVRARIPVLMICGDADTTVPYAENGLYLEKAYEQAGIPLLKICKHDCGHHPHGPLDRMDEAVRFLLEHSAAADTRR